MSIRTIIVDDELPICEEIEYLLQAHPDIKILQKFCQSQAALSYIQENPCDLIFLDISMPGMNGLEFAECISSLGLQTLIVFVTAYEEYALPAFATPAIGYITKPITQPRLTRTLGKVRSLLQLTAVSAESRAEPTAKEDHLPAPVSAIRTERISVQKDNSLIPLQQQDILLAYVKDKTVFLRTQQDDYPLSMPLSELLERLDPIHFLRVHRQYIVNLDAIEKVLPWFHGSYLLRLKDRRHTEVPVSRTHVQDLRQVLGIR